MDLTIIEALDKAAAATLSIFLLNTTEFQNSIIQHSWIVGGMCSGRGGSIATEGKGGGAPREEDAPAHLALSLL